MVATEHIDTATTMPRNHERAQNEEDAEQPRSKRQKLTDSQLERKRELDREAQRTVRERTKNHIAHLETLVQQLQGEKDGQVERLVAQLNESRAEINRLKEALNSIVKISTAIAGVDASSTSPTKNPSKARAHVEGPAIESTAIKVQDAQPPPCASETPMAPPLLDLHRAVQTVETESVQNPIDLDSYNPFVSTLASMPQPDDHEDTLGQTSSALINNENSKQISISQMAKSIVSKKKLEGRYWYLAGVLLSHILKTQKEDTLINFIHDEDIAIRAVFEGWSAVLERYPLDRGWQWLKELDETIYFNFFGPAERLMHLRNCRYQFLHQLYPNAGWDHNLPAFFAPRPSQQYLEHDPLIEHYPWPAFRERLLFSPRKFATNKFMEALQRNMHFIWNYDPSDMYQKDHFTGLFSYSEVFTKHVMDIKCYTAKPKFFDEFPELRSDIPLSNDLSPLTLFAPRISVASSSSSSNRTSSETSEKDDDCIIPGIQSVYSDSAVWQLGWETCLSPSFVDHLQSS